MLSSSSARTRALVRALLILLLAALAAAPSVVAAEPAAAGGVVRVSDGDRVATAARVAEEGWDTAPHVLLATAVNYPDAIAGAALASRLDAPLLLTRPQGLDQYVTGALSRLQTQRVTILGGERAVPQAIEDQLVASGLTVDRVQGSDRFVTAADLARAAVGEGGSVAVVALALGNSAVRDAWPDALAAASLAGLETPVPTLLVRKDELTAPTAAALQELAPGHVIILGGTGAVSDAVATQVKETLPGVGLSREAGKTRFGTAVEVAEAALGGVTQHGELAGDQAVFVSGEDFPDALGAGALAARRSAPLLLVPRERLADSVDAFIRDAATAFGSGILVGGTKAVSGFVHEELDAAVNGAPRPVPPPACDLDYSSPDCAYTYREPVWKWEALARCESGGNWSINTGNGYYGGLQFSLSTWRSVGGQGYPHQNSKWEQIHRGDLLKARSGWGQWPHCTSKLGWR